MFSIDQCHQRRQKSKSQFGRSEQDRHRLGSACSFCSLRSFSDSSSMVSAIASLYIIDSQLFIFQINPADNGVYISKLFRKTQYKSQYYIISQLLKFFAFSCWTFIQCWWLWTLSKIRLGKFGVRPWSDHESHAIKKIVLSLAARATLSNLLSCNECRDPICTHDCPHLLLEQVMSSRPPMCLIFYVAVLFRDLGNP